MSVLIIIMLYNYHILYIFYIECEPVSVWMMMRHGTRHPEPDEIKKMKEVTGLKDDIVQAFDEGRGQMCAQVSFYVH